MATIELNQKTIPANTVPISAVSTDVGLYIRYIGSQASATVEVAAGGDMTLKHGALAGEVVDTGIGSPNLDGVFDLSTPAAAVDTYGELLDLINKSTNWRARLYGVRRSDLTDNTLITLSATQAKGLEVGLLRDTTVLLTATLYVIGTRITHESLFGASNGGCMNGVVRVAGIGTSAGTHNLVFYSSNPLTKVDTEVWRDGLTSATAYEYNDVDFGALGAKFAKPGEDLLIQHQATTATITAPRLVVDGVYKFLGAIPAGRSAAISGQ